MYEVKATPGQRIVVHDGQARTATPTLLQVESDLGSALTDGDLRL